MQRRLYLDTCAWVDCFENRTDKFRPIGEWTFALLRMSIENDDALLISDFVEFELTRLYKEKELHRLLQPYRAFLTAVIVTSRQRNEAAAVAKTREVPFGDALHAIIARDEQAILVTRDRHFEKLQDIVKWRKPEELL